MDWLLLKAFRELFERQRYEHRRSHLGDHVASFLYEDLVRVGLSPKLIQRVQLAQTVLNTSNRTTGRPSRRGDGTFGASVPGAPTIMVSGRVVPRGPIAYVQIGVETKILAKAMIKQIDRVISDLSRQAEHFRASSPRSICVAVVGVNEAERYVSFEGRRRFPTDGGVYKHPIQESADARDRLNQKARSSFDEFIMLRFRATNVRPYPFEWADEKATHLEYAAALSRICAEYESRF